MADKIEEKEDFVKKDETYSEEWVESEWFRKWRELAKIKEEK